MAKRTLWRHRLLIAAAALALAACAAPAPLERAAPELPQRWQSEAPAVPASDERWWMLFGDQQLDRLVAEALTHNPELELAAARLQEARALAGIVDADRYPAISAGASSSRSKSTLEGSFPRPADLPRIQTDARLSLDASYEVDLWGRYASASAAARAELLASEWAGRGVRVALIADVIRQYHALRAADQREATLHRTLAGREDALDLLARRVAAGSASEFDLQQTRGEIHDLRAQTAQARQSREQIEAALSVLLGRSPRAIVEDSPSRGEGHARLPLQVPAGLPSDLLLRRPDLREAEQALAAADARVAEARAQLFPSIQLTASLGQESVALSRLFNGTAAVFQFGLGLTQPIWNAGRLQGNIEASRARQAQAEARYRQAIASAFGDVRRALAAQSAAADSLAAQQARSATLQETLRKARLRLEAGVTGRLEVLDAERNLLQAELAAIDAAAAQRQAVADLMRALGGGWQAEGDSATLPPTAARR